MAAEPPEEIHRLGIETEIEQTVEHMFDLANVRRSAADDRIDERCLFCNCAARQAGADLGRRRDLLDQRVARSALISQGDALGSYVWTSSGQ
jgi:hypothetical protein